ncbi:WD repeat-containing protein 62-like Protein [Tribolium castaneum]|uniref:WD repeat-containing protein 62-like Protein n=1 Tax=Tribolium castaneum TaxID=7070 RepID=D2A5M0_TRICA|nr:WD repeat-containing protein 62-like Protein [Tribolium castaneum]
MYRVVAEPLGKKGRMAVPPDDNSPSVFPHGVILLQIKLEKVLGVTVSSNAALASDNDGTIAYPAGCTVVLFNTKTEEQHHIINTSRKTITSLAFSSCGRYVVTGECGHQPAVRVWDLYSDPIPSHPGLSPQPQQVAEFVGHKYGVNCVAFSPSGKYVVSVGTQHDMIVNVWDWKNNVKVASNKVSTKVKAVAFAENGSYFVTVGNRHVKFWFLEYGKSKYKEAVPLMGRSAILGEQRNNYFCDVACGKAQSGDSTYAITRSGLLCEFNNRRLLDKWVELRTTRANCITVGENYIFVGCAEGIIRCFDPATLRFITTLPRTHYLGVDVSQGTSISHMASPPPDAKYPDAVALTYNETNHKLTSIYNDHSIYVWDVFNIKRVGKSYSFLYHSACIWGVEMAPPNSPLPPGSFLTCSSDDTIRVWSLDKITERNAHGMYRPNVYSNELLKIVYVDKDLSYIKDLDLSVGNNDKQQETSYDGRNGVRCIRVSPDGKHLASGDRSGNIRIHETTKMREMFKIEAHDAEVLCLEYCGVESDLNLMASASRDRLLHVFDVRHGYEFLQTLDDHSSSITAVRFLTNQRNTQMVSCGADKSLIFRSLGESGGKPQFTRDHNATGKTTLYDMEVDAGQKHVLTACQDRNVRIYSVNTGKHTKSFKGSTGDDGTLIKVVLDRSGIYLATSCTDKSLSVYDYYSGECMATMCGHSELATGLRFTNDCRRLISASGDGCIFVWKVPHDMVVTMHARLSQQAMRQGKTLDSDILNESGDLYDNESDARYRFSIGQLPQWAKKQLNEEASHAPSVRNVAVPKGRWAQRAEHPLEATNFYSLEKKFDSDVSLEETRITKKTMENITLTRGDTDTGFESAAHDGDIDSDHEYRRPLYYPNQVDSASGSEFTVTNIDADELRKSQRKKKGPNPQIVIQATSSTYGSQDSDDDDDEASTPSGENTDRNPMSLFSVSSESLDQLGTREKYLQSTFESMSGAETELTPGKTTISSKFLRSSEINMAAINAVKLTKSDPETALKRQLLNKRIAETKKKLESVGHTSPLKYSQSIHDLSHIPERDKSTKKQGNDVCTCLERHLLTSRDNNTNPDLQLCGCFMQDVAKNTSQLSHIFNTATFHAANLELDNDKLIRPRKLQLDKTLVKYKLHKSLPVSPVSEERSFSDFVQQQQVDGPTRKSFSYFVDFEKIDTREGFKQVCSEIEKFSQDFNRRYDQIDEDGNFSSDSLEEYSFRSVGPKKIKPDVPPRRCVSSNELSNYQDEVPKSESFYLNPNIKTSQDSILSDDLSDYPKSYCNSMESILSNDSDCKSAPLEALFAPQKKLMQTSHSVPKNLGSEPPSPRKMRTSQTQTDFPTPQDIVSKKTNASAEFQEKLLRFENIAKKPVAFFVDSEQKVRTSDMYIPTLATKNQQYKSKFCNVLNNKPEFNVEIYESGGNKFVAGSLKFEKNTNRNQETSSLDRHLFTKSLITEKICHKPPKAVRRHSSKVRKTKTYEYVRKEDYYSNNKLNNRHVTDENTIEVSYKEKNLEKDLETSPNILTELYDSLDKSAKVSAEVNLNVAEAESSLYDSVNLCSEDKFDKTKRYETIQFALENIKILNEIQRKIHKINNLVDIFKKNMCSGKVRALSSMYESMTNYYNDLTKLQATPIKFRRRNLSLPSFVERRLEVYVHESSPDSSLRRSCSLSDLSMQKPVVKKIEVSGKKAPPTRSNSRYSKNNGPPMTRSRSSGVLNQSDSENEDKKMSRLMRPTISSHNKINNKSLQSRKKQSYSTSNLNTVGVDNVSTSDDEEVVQKPAVPPRNRMSYNGPPAVTPRRHLNNKEKSKGGRHTSHFEKINVDLDTTLINDDDNSDLSVDTVEISHQLCNDVIQQLTKAADNVVGLYNRLSDTETDTQNSSVAKMDMVKDLEMSILNTHKVLHECIFKKLKQSNGNVDVNQTDTVKKLNDLVSKGSSGGPNSAVSIMEQYSDILLDMVQQKIHNSNI